MSGESSNESNATQTVRAKFRVDSIERRKWFGGSEVQTIKLQPVHTGSEENQRFYEATPGGAIELACARPEAAAMFELGGEYFVDFTPAR